MNRRKWENSQSQRPRWFFSCSSSAFASSLLFLCLTVSWHPFNLTTTSGTRWCLLCFQTALIPDTIYLQDIALQLQLRGSLLRWSTASIAVSLIIQIHEPQLMNCLSGRQPAYLYCTIHSYTHELPLRAHTMMA